MNPCGGGMLAYLRLIRFSNTPTAVADIVAGYLLATAALTPWPTLLALILTSVCLYSWGMVLNDLCDYPADKAANRQRPLVSGDVSLNAARCLAWLFLTGGVLLAVAAGLWDRPATVVDLATMSASDSPAGSRLFWPVTVVAPLLLCIWLYDGPLKSTPLAPFLMGGCRGLNILLGASLPMLATGGGAVDDQAWGPWSTWPREVWVVSGAMSWYVAGITWYARSESSTAVGWHLKLGTVLMATGVGLLALGLPWWGEAHPQRADIGGPRHWQPWWPLAVLLLGFSSLRRAVWGVCWPQPRNVQRAIVTALATLVFLNAAVCLYANPRLWPVALGVAGLILPIQWLRRFISPT